MTIPKRRTIKSDLVFKIFWSYIKKYPWFFGIALLGGTISQLSHIVGPLYIKELFDLLTTPGVLVSALVAPITAYVVVNLIGWVGGRFEMWLGYTLISKITNDLTNDAFANLIRHSYQFFTSNFAGALTRRVARFSGSYENLHYAVVTQIFQALLYVVGISIVLTYKNVLLGNIVIFWVAVFIGLQWFLGKWQQPLRLARAEEDSNLTAALADSISNQNTITLFSGYQREEAIVGEAAKKYRVAQTRSWQTSTMIYGVQGLLSILLNVGMLWLGIWLWQKGALTVGDLVLIQAYIFGLFEYVWTLGRQFQVIYTALADASEMAEIMDTPFGIRDRKSAKPLAVGEGEVWFDNVNFYFNKLRPVLKDFNLTIAGGERVALVGPSGAGKSTVTKLLLRLFDLPEGEIKIDKQDIAKVTQESLRNAISFVPQEPILFHRSLMENIRYGRRDATDDEVIEAAKKAHCHEFISELQHGYETFVGERGVKLSGGERQRVAIARAILKDAPILVLDEATSSLDSESEALIQDALETLMKGKTVVVIAHRLSTIMKMDRIVVMEQGKIIAQGTHLELIRERGLYQKLWSIQAGGFIGSANEQSKRIGGDGLAEGQDEDELLIDEDLLAEGVEEK